MTRCDFHGCPRDAAADGNGACYYHAKVRADLIGLSTDWPSDYERPKVVKPEAQATAEAVEAVLSRLPAAQATLLTSYFGGKSQRDLAAEFALDQANIVRGLRRARVSFEAACTNEERERFATGRSVEPTYVDSTLVDDSDPVTLKDWQRLLIDPGFPIAGIKQPHPQAYVGRTTGGGFSDERTYSPYGDNFDTDADPREVFLAEKAARYAYRALLGERVLLVRSVDGTRKQYLCPPTYDEWKEVNNVRSN